MELECLSWIGHMWNQVTNIFRKNVEPLPSEIVCEILSRLPADEVLRCLSVCKEWRAVVSAPYFSRYHLTRASPVVLVQYIPYEKPFNERGLQFAFIDLGAKMVKINCSTPTLKRANYLPRVLFSYNGLIVLEASYYISYFSSYFPRLSSYFIVYNPITRQEVYLNKPYKTGYICAIYFHSLTGEYRTIYTFKNPKAVTYCWSYLTSALTTTKWFPLPIVTFAPPLKDGPVNINGFVYWMIDTKVIDYTAATPPLCTAYIIAFDTKTEEVRVMAHPGTKCSSCGHKQKYMQLLHVENRLAFTRISVKLIKIWVLEDSTKWLWAKRYRVNFDFDVKQYPSATNLHYYIKLFYIPDGQLLMYWDSVGLFQYHLELKTFRKIDVMLNGRNVMSCDRKSLCWTSYTKSFESFH